MKFKVLPALVLFGWIPFVYAAPVFWNVPNATPTPPEPPDVQQQEEPAVFQTASPTPVPAPALRFPTATPTPLPGLKAKNPTEAALFSVVVPGSGQVYAGDPAKGLVFAALFGLGLWQTIDNLSLVPDQVNGGVKSKNEDAGELFGLATLAVYGFGIQDAFNTTDKYNKEHYLVALNLGIAPYPNAILTCHF